MGLHGDKEDYSVILVAFSDSPVIADIYCIIPWIFIANRVNSDHCQLDCRAVVKVTQLLVQGRGLRC